MKKSALVITVIIILSLLTSPQPAAAQAEAYTVIQMVNNLRAEYGLAPLTIDSSLMNAAQAHSVWASGIGTHSHTGIGGSTPKDRALAAGYGGGIHDVSVGENIYYGTMATPESAIAWWRNSSIHFQTMTSTNFTQIGCGVAYSDYGGFFTLKFGRVLDGTPIQSSASGSSSANSSGSASAPPLLPIQPVTLAEPAEDGSITHTVEYGQTLWDIAESYEVQLSEIMALNRLTDRSVIQPGDPIIIQRSPVEVQEEAEGPVIHTVATGQTLFEIALIYGIDLDTLLIQNNIAATAIIRPGDQLLVKPGPDGENPILRAPLYHTVETGQTLSGIAALYGVSLDSLLQLNALSTSSLIKPGDKILIRPGDPTPTAIPPEPTIMPSPQAIISTEASPSPQPAVTSTEIPPASDQRGEDKKTTLIILVVLFLLGGGGMIAYGIFGGKKGL